MINCQFLLQQEGYWLWEALDTREFTIEEGKYRIIGEVNSCKNCDVEIYYAYQSFAEDKSDRLLFKRFRRLNSAGLVMIIPFTYFSPGWWEFSCESDFFAQIFGDFWGESLRLQVLPNPNSDRQVKKEKTKIKTVTKKSKKSSFFKLKSLKNPWLPNLFSFDRHESENKKNSYLLEVESVLPKKKESILLQKETVSALAGMALNIVKNDRYKKLLDIFREPDRNKIDEFPKTEVEYLPFQLNLLEMETMPQLTANFQASIGQILPPKITRSRDCTELKYPQLPKIVAAVSAPIPTINLNKPTSFKIQREDRPTTNFKKLDKYPVTGAIYSKVTTTNKNIDKVDRDFYALKLKERFWTRLSSLATPSNSGLKLNKFPKKSARNERYE